MIWMENLIKVWDSINSIENGTDYKRKTIYACANGQNSTAYGSIVDNKLCLMSELLL